jgi:hypothetical protein
MRPELETLLADLLSKDGQRIWSASWAVVRLWDRDALRWLARHVAQIRAATAAVPLGGALRPNEQVLDLALFRMGFAASSACFCALYAKDMFADPKCEAEAGVIDLLSQQDNAETWETIWQVACRTCGQPHAVLQNDGWHMPTYRWTPMPR